MNRFKWWTDGSVRHIRRRRTSNPEPPLACWAPAFVTKQSDGSKGKRKKPTQQAVPSSNPGVFGRERPTNREWLGWVPVAVNVESTFHTCCWARQETKSNSGVLHARMHHRQDKTNQEHDASLSQKNSSHARLMCV